MFLQSARLGVCNFLCAIFLAVFCLFFDVISFATADWNSGATIEDISTRIAINIVNEGVEITVDLTPNAVAEYSIAQLNNSLENKQTTSLKKFALSAISIREEAFLQPKIKSLPDMNTAHHESDIVIKTFFPFSGQTQPKKIEIIPNFDLIKKIGGNFTISVSHHGLPVIDHGVLTQAEVLNLNWQDPWYSHFLNPTLKRDHNDPVMAFLYIEPRQIKSEIIVRIKEIAGWANLELRDKTMIYPDEFALIKQKVGQFLLAQNKLSADTNSLSAALDRVDYIRMGASDIQAYEPQQAQQQIATLIGVSLTHQVKALPMSVKWQWNLFNDKIQRVSIRAYDPAGLFDSYVTPEHPIFEWENMLADIDLPELSGAQQSTPVPVSQIANQAQYYWLFGIVGFLLISLISCRYIPSQFRPYARLIIILITLTISYMLIKSDKLNLTNNISLEEVEANPILKKLLWNIYQAFESTQEDLVYNQLANSVSGDLRETLYLQNRQSFLAQDGAWSKVKEIKIQSLAKLSTLSKSHLFDCQWLVIGEVIHWGHQHRRENLYHAKIEVSPTDGNWKIHQLESIGQQRVDDKKY